MGSGPGGGLSLTGWFRRPIVAASVGAALRRDRREKHSYGSVAPTPQPDLAFEWLSSAEGGCGKPSASDSETHPVAGFLPRTSACSCLVLLDRAAARAGGKSRTHRPIALVFLGSLLLSPPAERWPSGRRHTPAKGAGGKPSRGFESLPLRHLPSRKRSPDPAAAGFLRCFRGLCGLS